MEIRDFAADDVEDAGRLLAERHRAHRRREPLLPPQYEDVAAARAQVEELWSRDGASGAVAVEGSRAVGYLLGAPRADPTWGRNTWVELAGLAGDGADLTRALYAHAGQRWGDSGNDAHYVLVPAGDAAVLETWWRLGFGLQHVHAAREAAAYDVRPGIRRAREEDVPALAELDLLLPQHQALAPVFSAGSVPTREELLADMTETLADERFTVLVAEDRGEVVGSAVACPVELSGAHSGLARLEGATFFAFSAVRPAARGVGWGRALGEAVLDLAHRSGAPGVISDWRSTNLLSSLAWTRLGFRETFWRMHRVVGF